MKRVISIVLLIVLAMSLTACTAYLPYERTVSTEAFGEVTLRVNPLSRTITCGEDEYHYEKDGSSVIITYPGGGIYREDLETGSSGSSGITNSLPGKVLVSVLTEDALATENEPWIVIVSVIFGLLGLWHLILPKRSLFVLAFGWGIWKAEESPRNIRAIRLVGAVMVAAALFCIAI